MLIELREKYDAGLLGGLNIQVCNMSLGGSTLFAGRDLFDTAADVLLQKGIVSVVSAGNEGPSSVTVGSPGTHFGALTVGAASQAHNERILRRVQFGPVVGALYRPFLGTQTSYFSSRGPNADGRNDPGVTANGFASYGQGFSSTILGISIASGTSFSGPTVAGVAALLRQGVSGRDGAPDPQRDHRVGQSFPTGGRLDRARPWRRVCGRRWLRRTCSALAAYRTVSPPLVTQQERQGQRREGLFPERPGRIRAGARQRPQTR